MPYAQPPLRRCRWCGRVQPMWDPFCSPDCKMMYHQAMYAEEERRKRQSWTYIAHERADVIGRSAVKGTKDFSKKFVFRRPRSIV